MGVSGDRSAEDYFAGRHHGCMPSIHQTDIAPNQADSSMLGDPISRRWRLRRGALGPVLLIVLSSIGSALASTVELHGELTQELLLGRVNQLPAMD